MLDIEAQALNYRTRGEHPAVPDFVLHISASLKISHTISFDVRRILCSRKSDDKKPEMPNPLVPSLAPPRRS